MGGGVATLVSLLITAWAVGGMLLNKWEKMQDSMNQGAINNARENSSKGKR